MPSNQLRALRGELLLEAWERGLAEDQLGRNLTLLAVALDDDDRNRLIQLTVVECTELLLELYELTCGPLLSGFGVCEQCGAELEFSLPVAELAPDPAARREPIAWTSDRRRFRLRPVTMLDLLDTLGAPDAQAAEDQLLASCLTITPPADGRPATDSGVLARFEELHASSELTLTIACPGCGAVSSSDLDIGRFLWSEVQRAASRLLGEIDALAGAYGWSEREILGLSAQRRASYLELVEQ